MSGHRFHLHKKVITWPQLWKFCNGRRLAKLCDINKDPESDKSCHCDDATKGRCPIWNGQLEVLVMFDFKQQNDYNPIIDERDNNGEANPIKERSFKD